MIHGSFSDNEGNEYVYKVTDWFGQDHHKRKGSYYKPSDFMKTDRIWVETRSEDGTVRHTTVMGPFGNKLFIEAILRYDYTEYASTATR